jgi:CheY-like chemotaxis protein
MLKHLGYEVLEAADGPAALEVLSRSARVDLLFTDLAMPGGLNGRELASRVLARHPGVKVLLTSAYTDQLPSSANERLPITLLDKPYREPELAAAIRAALDSGKVRPLPVRASLKG